MKDNGGPAFPEAIAIGPAGDVHPGFGGMSLRDWFAGQALVGLLASPRGTPTGELMTDAGVSRNAYLVADAMIAESNK